MDGFSPIALTAHRDRIVSVSFGKKSMDIYSTSRDGTLLVWRSRWVSQQPAPNDDGAMSLGSDGDSNGGKNETLADASNDDDDERDTEGSTEDSDSEREAADSDEESAGIAAAMALPDLPRWSLSREDKHYFLQDHAKVICATFHSPTEVLVVGFSNGTFGLYELPSFSNIHTLSISNRRITTVCANPSGEWLGFGCAKAGQLLVWEWQSETYVLKQQGHGIDTNDVAYSPDGQFLATGGDDGKLKLWSAASGFCVVTFTEHKAGVSAVTFAQSGLAVLSSSLDGTVRAYDLIRYRNFRTFTSPEPTQFSSLAVDPSGELVCAGCLDTFQVCVWSMKTGRLLEMLAGHEAPVSGLAFHPARAMLASSSWDNTVRVWDIFEKKATRETLEFGSDVLALAFRPDGRELASSTLNGNLTLWDVTSGGANLVGTIEGRRDIRGGRLATDRVTARRYD